MFHFPTKAAPRFLSKLIFHSYDILWLIQRRIHSLYLLRPFTLAKAFTQVFSFSTSFIWSAVKLVDVTRKCFSKRFIRAMGNLLYTTSFSAMTISLKTDERTVEKLIYTNRLFTYQAIIISSLNLKHYFVKTVLDNTINHIK